MSGNERKRCPGTIEAKPHAHAQAHKHSHTPTHKHAHTHTQTHTYAHTDTQNRTLPQRNTPPSTPRANISAVPPNTHMHTCMQHARTRPRAHAHRHIYTRPCMRARSHIKHAHAHRVRRGTPRRHIAMDIPLGADTQCFNHTARKLSIISVPRVRFEGTRGGSQTRAEPGRCRERQLLGACPLNHVATTEHAIGLRTRG